MSNLFAHFCLDAARTRLEAVVTTEACWAIALSIELVAASVLGADMRWKKTVEATYG